MRGYDTGMASAAEVAAALSARAVRRSARITRPSLERPHRAALREVGIPLGRHVDVLGRRLFVGLEEVVLAVAPPRAGKTAWLGNVVLDAPGACVATSTKTDLHQHTAALRSEHGPVVVFNPEHLGGLASTLRWSPIEGCADAAVAISRAGYLIAGSATGAGTQDRQFWEGNAHKVLRCYLFAAAVAGSSMADVARWVSNPRDRTPLDVLERHAETPPGWRAELKQLVEGVPEKTRDSVFMSLALALHCMSDPAISRALLPRPGEAVFDVERFLMERGTLYLLASERPHGSLSPLFTALTGHIFETAKTLASNRIGGRLDPPLMLALDEAALICPVPLERWTADGGGRGIPMVIAVQSPSQLVERWGKDAAETIWNNAAVKLIFGGLTVAEHLDGISSLCGERDERVRSWSDADGKRSRSAALRRVPVFSPDALRTLSRLRVLILHRTTRPVLGRIEPVWTRPDVRRAASPAGRKDTRGERR